VSAVLYFVNMLLTAVASRRVPQPAAEFAEAISGADQAPVFLDRWRPWLALAAVLIAIAYGPTLVRLAATTSFASPGFRVW
jgi:cytochrome c oxidase subunit 1